MGNGGKGREMRTNKPRPPRPESTIWEPLQRRILVTDATYESLHTILSQNPGGCLCTRDELSGFLASLDADNRQAERPFWLSLWTGSGHHTLDRIGRGHIYVENVCGSLFGNLVPQTAARLVTAMASGKQDDGFLQRFSLAVWPDMGSWRWIDRPTDPIAAETWERVVRSIVALSGVDPLPMDFNPEAQEVFVSWYTDLQTKIHSDRFHPAMQSHLAKYPKTLVVIAAIYELAELADSGKLASHAAAEEPYLLRVRQLHSSRARPQCAADRPCRFHFDQRSEHTEGDFRCFPISSSMPYASIRAYLPHNSTRATISRDTFSVVVRRKVFKTRHSTTQLDGAAGRRADRSGRHALNGLRLAASTAGADHRKGRPLDGAMGNKSESIGPVRAVDAF